MKEQIEFRTTLRECSGSLDINVDPKAPADLVRGGCWKRVEKDDRQVRNWIGDMMVEWLEETTGMRRETPTRRDSRGRLAEPFLFRGRLSTAA